jgi:hypothetical protein
MDRSKWRGRRIDARPARVRDLLSWQRHFSDTVDLYIPEFPIYRDSLEWLLRRDGFTEPFRVTDGGCV